MQGGGVLQQCLTLLVSKANLQQAVIRQCGLGEVEQLRGLDLFEVPIVLSECVRRFTAFTLGKHCWTVSLPCSDLTKESTCCKTEAYFVQILHPYVQDVARLSANYCTAINTKPIV